MSKNKIIWIYIVNLVLMAVNIALFGLWWSLIRVDAVPDGKIAEYQFTHISLQITVLAAVIGLGAVFFAGLGFIGFKTLVDKAERTADEIARDTAQKAISLFLENRFWETEAHKQAKQGRTIDVGEATEASD